MDETDALALVVAVQELAHDQPTLRDRLVIAAMKHLDPTDFDEMANYATACWQIADAVLSAREEGDGRG